MYGDTGVAEMDGMTGSIYSGDPGVDSLHHLVSHIISSHYTTNYTIYLSHLLIALALSKTPCGSSQPGSIIPSHPLPMLLEPEPLFLTNSFGNAVRGAAEC